MSGQVTNNRDGRPEEEEQEEEKMEFLRLGICMYVAISLPCGCGHYLGKKIIWGLQASEFKDPCLESSICGRMTEAVLALKGTSRQIAQDCCWK
jgi:hypothetical protein